MSYLGQDHDVMAINRNNYGSLSNNSYSRTTAEFDVFINANGNSKKYWANENPLEDFEKSVTSVYKTLYDFNFKRYIYISSIDIYKDNIYGFHKRLAEQIIFQHCPHHIILRCSSVIGKNMKKGVLKDILDGRPLFVTGDSTLQFITNTGIAKVIDSVIDTKGTMSIGSTNFISINDIGLLLGKKIEFDATANKQEYFVSPAGICDFKTAEEYIKEVIK